MEQVNVADIRAKTKLSQREFAIVLGVSLRTIQDWEQRRRNPSGPARALLRVLSEFPEVLVDLT